MTLSNSNNMQFDLKITYNNKNYYTPLALYVMNPWKYKTLVKLYEDIDSLMILFTDCLLHNQFRLRLTSKGLRVVWWRDQERYKFYLNEVKN